MKKFSPLEPLEARIAPATLGLSGSVLDYRAGSGFANMLTVSVADGSYTFTDTAETITLSGEAMLAGFTGSGTHTVTGPDSAVGFLDIRTGDLADTITLLSANDPMLVDGGFGGDDTIRVNGPINATGPNPTFFQAANFIQLAGATIASADLQISTKNATIAAAISATGRIKISPAQAGYALTLGREIAGTLSLTAAELDFLQTPGVLEIGAAFAGPISIAGTIAPSKVETLVLKTGADITATATGAIYVSNLGISAVQSVTLRGGNDVDVLGADVSGENQAFTFGDTDDLRLGIVDGMIGVHAGVRGMTTSPTGSVITLTAGATTQVAGASVLANELRLLGAGPFNLNDPANDVGTIAAAISGALSFTDADGLRVGAVGETRGITTSDSALSLIVIRSDLSVTDTHVGADLEAGTGHITLQVGEANASGQIAVGSSAGIHATGGVTFIADRLSLNAAVNAGTSRVLIRPFEANTPTGLDLADSANLLGVSTAEINQISAGVLEISSGAAASLSVDGAISPLNVSTLHLKSADFVAIRSSINVSKLAIEATGSLLLSFSSVSDVDTLAVSSGSDVSFRDSDDLTIGTVDGVIGVRADFGSITLGAVGIAQTAPITQGSGNEAVLIDGGGGAVTLNDVANDFRGPLTIANAATATITDADDLLLGAQDITAQLTVTAPGSVTQSGVLTGAGAFAFNGGTLVLSEANRFLGATTLMSGVLRGNGGVAGALVVGPSARFEPGDSTGSFASGAATLAGAGLFVRLNGITPETGHEQLKVTGTVDLTGATLTGTLGFSPAFGDQFVIIDNDGTDPVTGTFAGALSGNLFVFGNRVFRVDYAGGDGNDVVLTAATPPVTLSASNKVATFTDIDGDRVKVTTNKGSFALEDFFLVPNGGLASGSTLTLLDLTSGQLAGANVTFTAKRSAAGGNGFVNVGRIDSTNFDLGKVTIAGDLAQIDAGDSDAKRSALKSLTVQSLGALGVTNEPSGADLVSSFAGKLDKLTVKSDVRGAVVLASGAVGAVKVGGSFIGGQLSTDANLGSLNVRGDIVGTESAPVVISAFGKTAAPNKGIDLAIKSLKVSGGVEYLRVLAGYDTTGTGANADASIGSIKVIGDWRASTVLAGVGAGVDGFEGTNDDATLTGAGVRNNADIISKIASIAIGGQAFGSTVGGDSFGIIAERIGAAKIGKTVLPFQQGARNDFFAAASTGPGPTGFESDFSIGEAGG